MKHPERRESDRDRLGPHSPERGHPIRPGEQRQPTLPSGWIGDRSASVIEVRKWSFCPDLYTIAISFDEPHLGSPAKVARARYRHQGPWSLAGRAAKDPAPHGVFGGGGEPPHSGRRICASALRQGEGDRAMASSRPLARGNAGPKSRLKDPMVVLLRQEAAHLMNRRLHGQPAQIGIWVDGGEV